MTSEELWKQFGKDTGYETVSFGNYTDTDQLSDLILNGKKTATSSAYYWVETGEEKMPKEGSYEVVIDSKENAICIIQITNVYITPFNQVSPHHAYLEGEGDRSLSYWRKEHRRFFKEDLLEAGIPFQEDMPVVCEEFRKVFPK